MTDDLDDLNSALRTATPAPDTAKKAAHLALAQKNFAELQGTRDEARLMSERPKRGFMTGVMKMLNTLTSRGGLAATTALVAVAFVALVPMDAVNVRLPWSVAPQEQTAGLIAEPDDSSPMVQAPENLEEQPADVVVGAIASVSEATQKSAPAMLAAPAPMPFVEGRSRMLSEGRFIELPDTETYANADQNPLRITAETPVSTFSIDVDTASYAIVRNSLMNGQMPPADAVRVEEMVNYFPYAYPAPTNGAPFQPTVSVSQTPWNPDTQLVHIAIQGEMPALDARPPLNLVFLIDTSGSMNQPNKLPLLKQSFRLMLSQLRPEDRVAIVTYAGSAGQVLEPTTASERATILAALDQLDAGGSTAGQAGLQQAYAVAAGMAKDGDVTRVILATDGDFNVGLSDPKALTDYIVKQRESGTYLSVLGFGRGNLDDTTMQALAQNGNGQASYIDTLSEAQKVLVDQLTGALFPIAGDVKIQVEFNPATVAEYRLIGYETRMLERTDFNNDAMDAGDIGAGIAVTALYEITPVGSPALLSDPLRYQSVQTESTSDELGFLRLRYQGPGASESQLIETPISRDLPDQTDTDFATAIAGFGQLLRGDDYLGDWDYGDAIALANASKGDDPFGYRAEAIRLMRLAQSLSE
ncbi:MAG: VWA domain-containing protein [Rhodobacteraceae bacterium]|nr:VWA domain-containing protein [Paracoccaceae bacterium]